MTKNEVDYEPTASSSSSSPVNFQRIAEQESSSHRAPSSPQINRASSAFSKQIQLLKQQSEGIHEESDEDSASSDSDSARKASKNSRRECPKSKEAEDALSINSEKIRHRTFSVSEDNKQPIIKSILRQSPFISNEDLLENNSSLQNSQNVSFSDRNEVPSKFQSTQAHLHAKDLTEPGDIDAIDQYYAKNHYTVTGHYKKNQLHQYVNESNDDELGNEEKDENHQNEKPFKRSLSMAQSTRSMPIIPINNRFHQSFYWFAHNHKKFGFRHFCMVLLVFLYTLAGAALFYSIESKYEIKMLKIHKTKLERVIFEIAQRLELEILDPEKLTNITQLQDFLKNAYVNLLEAEELYSGSTFYKEDDPENRLKWTYGSACFFSMNVYTTTGYGSIAPSSNFGKTCVMIYGLIFVPLTAVVIRDLGQLALLYLTKMYTIITDSLRRARGFVDKFDEDEIMSLPIKFSVSIMIMYLLSATIFIFEYDAVSGPPQSGISFFNAFYFSFISMSTIGLGDIMPNNVTFSPLITILFFFGMPILKVVNRVTYICLENGVFGTMTVLENRLDQTWSKATVIPKGEVMADDVTTHKKSITSDGMIPDEHDGSVPNEYLNNFTIRSIATFMRANGDVYGGGFGRVNMRRGDLRNLTNADNQTTIRSRKSGFNV